MMEIDKRRIRFVSAKWGSVSGLFQGTDLSPPGPYPVHGGRKLTQNATSAYPKTASIIALVSGIIILLGGALLVFASVYVLPNVNFNITVPQGLSSSALHTLVSGVVGVMGAFGLATGAIVLVSAIMLLAKVGRPRTWGILVLVFSILSFIGLGGFIVGAILGVVGGILALRWKPPTL
jgi:hypothetical protein